jgi:hypothetical protein
VTLDKVAKLIADPVPEGLVDYLDHFRDFIGSAKPGHRRDEFARMIWSIDFLIPRLEGFQHLPLGLQCPDDVADVLRALPRIRRMLEPMAKPPGRKRPPNVFKKDCAGVVVVACRRFNPDITRDRLHEICQAYWEACGAAGGDAGDWWWHCTEAFASDHHMAEQVLRACVDGATSISR